MEINAYNTHTSPKALRCLLPALPQLAQHTSHLCVSLLVLWDLLNNLIDRNFKKRFIYFIYRSTLSLSSHTPEEGVRSHYRWL